MDAPIVVIASVITQDGSPVSISDGYHTFEELYSHRISLYIALCRKLAELELNRVWRSTNHSDGSSFNGWFVLGINTNPDKQITYHLPMSRWTETEFAVTFEYAPKYDGHTPQDVLRRLKEL